MKRVRRQAEETPNEEVTAEAVATPSERKSGLLGECWADLRGRPRPVTEPRWEEELQSVSHPGHPGGVDLDDAGLRRMQRRYGASTN